MKTLWRWILTLWLYFIRGYRVCDSCKRSVPKRRPFLRGMLCEFCYQTTVKAVSQHLHTLHEERQIDRGVFDV